jgi:hypothetical protein
MLEVACLPLTVAAGSARPAPVTRNDHTVETQHASDISCLGYPEADICDSQA